MSYYVIAEFPGVNLGWVRLGGPGLGNLLFVWARAYVRALETGGELVAPIWHQIKVGPLIRREPDLRTYVDVFPFRPARAVWCEFRCRLLGRRIDRFEDASLHRRRLSCEVVTMGEMKFHDLESYVSEIFRALRGSARPSVPSSGDWRPEIAVHVRLGDYAEPDPSKPGGLTSTRLPIDWYLKAIHFVRDHFFSSKPAPVTVFSDGTNEELASLLAIEGVRRAPRATALSDIIAISNARYFISSQSTFSLWGVFFGESTVIMPRGLDPNRYFSRSFLAGRLVAL